MKLSEFKAKIMPGLYHYDHYEASNGAFIQARACGTSYIYQDEHGNRQEFYTFEALKQAVEV